MGKWMPELGDLNVGDDLVVVVRSRDWGATRGDLVVDVRVSAVDRDLVHVEPARGRISTSMRRFRLDDQRADGPAQARFYTPAQWAWQQRVDRAEAYLREAGVGVTNTRSRFEGDPVALANVIRRGLGEEEL